MTSLLTKPVHRRQPEPDALAILAAREAAQGPGFSYKLAEDAYALDAPASNEKSAFDDKRQSITFPFAASLGRDRVGDFLCVEGIHTQAHRLYPVAGLDHFKWMRWPLGLTEDPDSREYRVWIEEDAGLAMAEVFINSHVREADQAFKMFRSNILRAGSIGYRPLRVSKLPADPAEGQLKPGLTLHEVELLEVTLAVLPANGDCVRRCLEVGIEGEPLAPGWKSILAPFASAAPEMAVSGWHTKDAAHKPPGSSAGGQFTSGGGGGGAAATTGAQAKKKEKRRQASSDDASDAVKPTLAARVKNALAKHGGALARAGFGVPKERLAALYLHVPESMRAPVGNLWHATHAALMAGNTATKALAKRLMEDKGLSEEQVTKLAGTLGAIDLAFQGTMMATAIAAAPVAHGIALAAKAASYCPVASAAYILHASASPGKAIRTMKSAVALLQEKFPEAARGAAAFAWGAMRNPLKPAAHVPLAGHKSQEEEGGPEEKWAAVIADAYAAAADPDMWLALFSAAFDDVRDVAEAVEMANACSAVDNEGGDKSFIPSTKDAVSPSMSASDATAGGAFVGPASFGRGVTLHRGRPAILKRIRRKKPGAAGGKTFTPEGKTAGSSPPSGQWITLEDGQHVWLTGEGIHPGGPGSKPIPHNKKPKQGSSHEQGREAGAATGTGINGSGSAGDASPLPEAGGQVEGETGKPGAAAADQGGQVESAIKSLMVLKILRWKTKAATAHKPPGSPEGGQFMAGSGGGGATAEGGKKPKKAAVEKQKPPVKPKKERAVRGEMSEARREGKGDEARVVMADGSEAPSHIKPSMVAPDWKDVRVSLDPNADVLVTAKDGKGRVKTVYTDSWETRQDAAKFARTKEGLEKAKEMHDENQANRANPKLKERADCVWLMQEQATRPGSEKDNKGVEKLFGKPVGPQDVIVDGDKVSLKIGDETVPIKDKKTRAEIQRRLRAGENEDLEDSTYWLKSFGATTLEGRHVVVDHDGNVRLRFVGKESVWHDHKVRNPELAEMLLERKKAAGRAGKLFNASDGQVSDYTGKLDGGKFSPKDFRTQKATSLAIEETGKMEMPKDEKEYKKAVNRVGEIVSGVLGNEPKQALSKYIDPTVFSGWRAALAAAETKESA